MASSILSVPSLQRTEPITRSAPSQPTAIDIMSEMVMGTPIDPSIKPKKPRFAVGGGERPEDIYYRVTRQNNWWAAYTDMYKMFQENSLAFTLASRSATELTRFDIIMKPKFAKKCDHCGYESRTMIDICPECGFGPEHLHRPDKKQLDLLKKPNGRTWIEEANNSGQTLKELVKSFAFTQYQLNQAYLVCNTRTTYDAENGKKAITYPEEFLVIDPIRVQQLFDDSGELGKTYGFTMDNRNKMLALGDPKDADEIFRLNEEGKQIYPAAYKVGNNVGASGKYWLYMDQEVYQAHWFRPALTYGVPIWYSIWDDLRAWNSLEKHFFKKYFYGFTRKLMFIPGVQDDDIDEVTKGITDVLAKNDNSIPIICMPPVIGQTAEMRPYAIDLGTEDDRNALATKDNIMNRVCAFIGVPNIFAGDVEQSGGMNNESQQITVFDRFLTEKLSYIDDLLKRGVMCWFPGITDWEMVMDRPTKSETDAKKRIDKIQEMTMMKQAGFLVEWVDGEFHYSQRPFDQERMLKEAAMQDQMQTQQMAMMQAQTMQPQGDAGPEDNGILPGDGEGPKERGSARREDAEIDASKDEIEQSMREANL